MLTSVCLFTRGRGKKGLQGQDHQSSRNISTASTTNTKNCFMQMPGTTSKADADHQHEPATTTAEKVRLFEATAELAKLRAGLHSKEQEKATMHMQLQQQDFTVKKMSSDISRQKSDLRQQADLTLAAKDQQIEQLLTRLQQKESAVQQLYAALQEQQQQQQEAVALSQSKPKQNKLKLIDPEVLARIKGSSSLVAKLEHLPAPLPKPSAAATAAASFSSYLYKGMRQVNCCAAIDLQVGC